ncbi:acetylxylan esterase [Actinophytocola sp.]|uniref:acetylxylan esterase n=1 Tax=Actinophytocola sp. TaxID=1872138 RepID=UPI00389AF1F7
MPLWDLDLEELVAYAPEVAEPADFDDFWAETLTQARTHDLGLTLEPVDTGLALVEVFDVTFAGFGGQPVRGWLTRPRRARGPLPGVLSCNGYGGGRGLATGHLDWAVAGYVELFLDTRGQGSRWGDGGDTPDPVGSEPAAPGFMTRGITDPREYYYRRLYTDAARAVEALRAVDGVDPGRIAVTGGSQGGGMALAVAGLVPEVAAVLPDVPFLCHLRRGVEISGTDPYAEVATYLSVHRRRTEAVFRTLSYVDAVNHARRAVAPARFSVALMDTVSPPSTVYAAYNHYGEHAVAAGRTVPKVIDVWPFNEHEGGMGHQWTRQLPWLADLLQRENVPAS